MREDSRETAEEALAMLENERLAARNSATWWMLDERKRAQYVERAALFAHAAACVRFVAAIDAGTLERIDKASMHVRVYAGDDVIGVTAPTALEAFALATADTTEGR